MLITIPDDVDFFDPVTDLRTFFLSNNLISPKKPNINASLKLINFFSGTTKIDFTLLLIFILSTKYLLNVPPPVKRIKINNKVKAIFVVPEKKLINFKEALIFGFLGLMRLLNKKNVLKSVTGSKKPISSGIIINNKIF